jgi:hypothetical protein
LSLSPAQLDERRSLEDMYARFGWKWAVLASMAARLVRHGRQLPNNLLQDLKSARTRMESGCHSICEVAADMRELEIKFFPILLRISEREVDAMLELVGKAMNGTIQERDIDLSPLKPVLVDCTVPRICLR